MGALTPASASADYAYDSHWGSVGAGNGQFAGPSGVTTDSLDNLYVSDYGNDRVQVFTPDGEYVRSFVTGDGPADVAIDEVNDFVYVANGVANTVQKFNSAGVLQGTLPGSFVTPSGVAIDSDENVYVADWGNDRVQKFNSASVHQGNLGTSGTGLGEFDNPAGVEVSGTTLYVTDFNNDRVQRWSTVTGLPLGAFGDSTVFNGPIAVAISAAGTVFVADNDNNRVRAFDALGVTPGQIIGSAGSGNGQFDLPRGLATGSLNALFVTDESNRVQKFVEPVTGSSVRTSGTRLVFDAEAGRNNRVSVSQSGSTFTFTELAASDPDGADTVTPGAGCVPNGVNSVTCTNPSVTRISFTVENLDDTVTVQSSVNASVAATINGGAGADLLTGGPGNDVLAGGDGSDTLAGSGGTDTASYSDSATGLTINLAAGTATDGDTLTGIEDAVGSPGADTFVSGSGANALTGGGGADTVSYSASAAPITANLGAGTASDGDTFVEIENLSGSPQADVLTGDGLVNTISGAAGDDTIDVSAAGVDTANCGADTDSATAQVADNVAGDCESVVRTDATPPSGGGGGGTGGGGTPAPAGPGAAPAPTAPVLSSLAVPRMRSGRPGTFSYSLDKAANVTIAIEQVKAGRKIGRVCKKQTRKNRKKRACSLFVPIGKLSQSGATGRNTLRFSGKLGGRTLRAGVYRATALAAGAGGKSSPATTKFTVAP